MNEPLKDKVYCPYADRYACNCKEGKDKEYHHIAKLKDLKSAVEWLKEEDKKVYKEITELIKDIHSGVYSKVVAKFIRLEENKKKAFPDLKTSPNCR